MSISPVVRIFHFFVHLLFKQPTFASIVAHYVTDIDSDCVRTLIPVGFHLPYLLLCLASFHFAKLALSTSDIPGECFLCFPVLSSSDSIALLKSFMSIVVSSVNPSLEIYSF
jgi:hypothetical protein